MKKLLLFLLLPAACFGQGDQTIITVPLDGSGHTENAILHLPDDYSSTTTMYPIMVFLHGVGEGGTNPATLYNSSNAGGPAYFIAQGKFPSSFVNPVDGKSYKYIVVSPQSTSGWSTTAYQLDYILTYLLGHYRIDASRIYLSGLSAGGQGVTEYVGKIVSGGVALTTTHKIAAFVPMSIAEDGSLISPLAAAVAALNVPTWGFGSPSDTYGQYTLNFVAGIDAVKSSLGISTSYTGGHCCWNQFYNPTYRQNGMSIYEWALQYTSVSLNPGGGQPASNPISLPGTIQAANYSAMYGVATQSCSDAGGGLNVGWIDYGDWVSYNVNVATAGAYTVSYRIATPYSGVTLQLLSGSNVLSNVSIPNTGSFNNWQTVTTTVTLPAGQQTLKLYFNSWTHLNIHWIQVASGTATASDGITLSSHATMLAGDSSSTFGDKGFTVYPNPVHDQLNLRVYDQKPGSLVVQVTDAFGAVKAVYTFNKTSGIFQTSIAVSSWTSGVYFVRIQSGSKTDVRKIVKF